MSSISSDNSRFVYEPLSLEPGSIRLLKVFPGSPKDIIHCKIRQASMIEQYTCLSYVWGYEGDTEQIEINGNMFRIRRNLWEFLRVVRSASNAAVSKTEQTEKDGFLVHLQDSLWIDALCIDQASTIEKNHQVQQMGEIYSRAQRVISWLGNQSFSREAFIRALRCDVDSDLFDVDNWDYSGALQSLCEDIYWKRVWITQEVQLAREVYLMARKEHVALHLIQEIIRIRSIERSASRKAVLTTTQLDASATLLYNLTRFWKKECSNRLDRVYSLCSISSDAALLQVQYGISNLQLAHNLLRLYQASLCLWHVDLVVQCLRFNKTERASPDLVFCVSLKEVETVAGCPECQQTLNYRTTKACTDRKLDEHTLQAYIACMVCAHFESSEYGEKPSHFVLLVSSMRDAQKATLVFSDRTVKRLPFEVEITIDDIGVQICESTKIATICLPLSDILRVIPWASRSRFDFPEDMRNEFEVQHVSVAGLRICDSGGSR